MHSHFLYTSSQRHRSLGAELRGGPMQHRSERLPVLTPEMRWPSNLVLRLECSVGLLPLASWRPRL